MNMRYLVLVTLLTLGMPFATATAQTPAATEVAPGQLAQADVDFIQNANSENVAQVAMGHAAESTAVNPGVRELGTRIASSHTRADQGLRLLAGQKHVELAHTANAADNSQISELHNRKRGADFDAQYVRTVIADHDRLIEMYEAARNASQDADIRGYADTMLPTLHANRDQAVDLAKRKGLSP